MSESEKNLKEAFAGESQANRKYLAFAKKAEQDGYPSVARLFKVAAAAETIHAHNHLEVLKGVKSTLDNLKEAFAGEHHEFTSMYPSFLAKAKEEKNGAAVASFHWANEVEKIHGAMYQEAIDVLSAGGTLSDKAYYVCSRCGYPAENKPLDKCPVCGAKKEDFFLID